MLIKFGKEIIEIGDVEVETSLNEIKSRIEFITGCSNIKLILSGKSLNSALNLNVGSIPGGIMAKISAIGSKQTEIDSFQQSLPHAITRRIVNDLDGTVSSPVLSTKSAREHKHSPYRFGGIQTLPGLPDETIARSILEELSNDVGVLAVMEKHKFKVGALCELYPEGYVGVSDVCVMGLNEGNGIRILLRLRTDDLKGFRKILSIRKVLFHELTHNVHSDHDGNFYMLMRQIEREVVELDWRASKGRSTSGQVANLVHVPSTSPANQRNNNNSKNILGGRGIDNSEGGVILPARVAAGTAAIMRLSVEESEAERSCGSRNTTYNNQSHQQISTGSGTVIYPGSSFDITDYNEMTVSDCDQHNITEVIWHDESAVNGATLSSNENNTATVVLPMELDEATNLRTGEKAESDVDGFDHDIEESDRVLQGAHKSEAPAEDRNHSDCEMEMAHFEHAAVVVSRQMDDVISTAVSLSDSPPIERLCMLRDALGTLLRRNHAALGSLKGAYAQSSGSASKRSPAEGRLTVGDISDTLQLLRTIIGNAKVSVAGYFICMHIQKSILKSFFASRIDHLPLEL